ncbi:MAG: M23 family metallopeptidase [Proteobacteria bacterium]|nr:M23 family metallopeptidase [Pseudomonadota bacterium]
MKNNIFLSVLICAVCLSISTTCSARDRGLEALTLDYVRQSIFQCDEKLNKFLAKDLTVDQVCKIKDVLQPEANNISVTDIFPRNSPGDGNRSWIAAVETGKTRYHLFVHYNRKDKVDGTFLLSGLSAEEQHIPFSAYKAKGKYAPPFDGRWHVMQGGEYEVFNHHLPAWRNRCGNAFAYDFMKLSDRGTLYFGDPQKIENYPSFGEDVLAMADGTVVEVVEGIHDSQIGIDNSFGGAGNTVVINHGNGEHSTSVHLKQGSILVRAGDKVKRGQVIAKVGNSASTIPHLHVQLQNSGVLCAADSLRFGFSDVIFNGQKTALAYPKVGDSIENNN